MKFSQRKLTIAMTFLTAFVLGTSLVLLVSRVLAQNTGTRDGTETSLHASYDANGNLVWHKEEEHYEKGQLVWKKEYDKNNKLRRLITYSYLTGFKEPNTSTTTYGPDGTTPQSTVTTDHDKDGNVTSTVTIEYDANGNESGRRKVTTDAATGKSRCYKWNAKTEQYEEDSCPQAEQGASKQSAPTTMPKSFQIFEPGLKYEFTTSPGLNTPTFILPGGSKISINFPDDLSAGDTITGTVQTEVAGKDEKQRARNQRELDKYVLLIGGQPTRATEKMFTRTIPGSINAAEPFLVVMVNGKQAARAIVPIAQSPPAAPQRPQLPTCGQMGRNVVVKDHCDGIIAPTDSCSIGGTQLQPLAESPRMRVMQNTSEVPGLTEIKYSEQGKEVTGPFQNLGVKLTSPNTNLLRNQKTTMEVVALVQGIQKDVSLDLVNDTPSVVSLSGGDNQHFTIHPADVQADGTYRQNFTVTANSAGAWGATATVSCVGAEGPSGPVPVVHKQPPVPRVLLLPVFQLFR